MCAAPKVRVVAGTSRETRTLNIVQYCPNSPTFGGKHSSSSKFCNIHLEMDKLVSFIHSSKHYYKHWTSLHVTSKWGDTTRCGWHNTVYRLQEARECEQVVQPHCRHFCISEAMWNHCQHVNLLHRPMCLCTPLLEEVLKIYPDLSSWGMTAHVTSTPSWSSKLRRDLWVLKSYWIMWKWWWTYFTAKSIQRRHACLLPIRNASIIQKFPSFPLFMVWTQNAPSKHSSG